MDKDNALYKHKDSSDIIFTYITVFYRDTVSRNIPFTCGIWPKI